MCSEGDSTGCEDGQAARSSLRLRPEAPFLALAAILKSLSSVSGSGSALLFKVVLIGECLALLCGPLPPLCRWLRRDGVVDACDLGFPDRLLLALLLVENLVVIEYCGYCLAFALRSMLHAACCMVHVAFCMVHGAWCMVHAACCMLHAAWCMVHGACCMLHGSWCMLHAAYCILHGACCMLHAAWFMLHAACFMLHAPWCMRKGAGEEGGGEGRGGIYI